MRKSKGRAKSRFIGALGIEPSLAEKAFELRSASRKVVETGIQHDDNIVSRQEPILTQAPAFPRDTTRSVS